jgi:hypothetical protein
MAKLKSHSIPLGHYAAFNEVIVNCIQQASTFTVGACEILSARIFRFIKDSAQK